VSLRVRILSLLLLTWMPLVILAAATGGAAGHSVGLPLLVDYVVHVRFLVAMPVLIASEGVVWAKVIDLSRYLVLSGLISESGLPGLERLVERFNVLRMHRIVPAAAAVGVVFGVILLRKEFSGDLSTWQFVPGSSQQVRSVAGWWYLLVSVPIFQFLVLYWALRYAMWCWFLFRLSRLDLVLVPSHPDRSAGLRPVGQVHQHWALVVFALSSVVSANVGLAVVHGQSLTDFRVEIVAFLGLSLVVLFAPFLAFSGKLLTVRMRALLDYGVLAAEYTRRFDQKWLATEARPDREPLLGTADLQSLADLANSYGVVHDIRIVPFEMVNVLAIVLAVAIPFVPLVFAVISPVEVFKSLAQFFL
jgi:hypothetical protein